MITFARFFHIVRSAQVEPDFGNLVAQAYFQALLAATVF